MRGNREPIHFPGGHSFRVLRWTQSPSAVEIVIAPGKYAPIQGEGEHWHYHGAMELTLFTAGEGVRFVGDHIGSFTVGDLVLLGEKLPHFWQTRGLSAGLCVQWEFPPDHPFHAFPEAASFSALFREAAHGLRYTGYTAAVLAAGMHELAGTSGADRLGLLFRLLARLAAAPAGDRTMLSRRAFSLSDASAHRQSMVDVVHYLLANFRGVIRLEEVLHLTGLSKPTFARQFKKHAGQTFRAFVAQVRLQAACRELVETERPVLEVALACGFTQLSFFNRLFRRVHGCTPTQYRRRRHRRKRSSDDPAR